MKKPLFKGDVRKDKGIYLRPSRESAGSSTFARKVYDQAMNLLIQEFRRMVKI